LKVEPSHYRVHPGFVARWLASLSRQPNHVELLPCETLVDASRPAWTTAMVTAGWDRVPVFATNAAASPSADPPRVSRGQPEARFVPENFVGVSLSFQFSAW